MNRTRVVAAILASVMLSACGEPPVTSAPEDEASVDSDFETAELRAGKVRTRTVQIPAGYTLVDMNNRGDLLLGAAWLPTLRKRPLALPFAGRSITNDRQILGPGRLIYKSGRVTELPDPCIPFTVVLNAGLPDEGLLTFDCVGSPVAVSILAENGDALVQYRQDARGTMASPFRFFKIWREHSQSWQTVVEFGSSESGVVDAAISDTGLFAIRISMFPWMSGSNVSNGHGLQPDGICRPEPGPLPSDPQAIPLAVNDAGEVVGRLDCQQLDVEVTGVRWSRTGMPTRLNGMPSLIDNFGNAAGIRETDGHAVIWLVDGTAIDLTAAVGNQPVSVRRFLKRGQIFGFAGTQPMIWRFGF